MSIYEVMFICESAHIEGVTIAIADEQARPLQCIGEPTWLQILKPLTDGEKYVGEIISNLKKDQSLISYHLRHLRECNIVVVRREAQRAYSKGLLQIIGF